MKINISIEIPPEELIQVMQGSSELALNIQKQVADQVVQEIVRRQTDHLMQMLPGTDIPNMFIGPGLLPCFDPLQNMQNLMRQQGSQAKDGASQ